MTEPSPDDIWSQALDRQSKAVRTSLLVERWVSEWFTKRIMEGKFPSEEDMIRLTDRFWPLAKALVERLERAEDTNCPLEE